MKSIRSFASSPFFITTALLCLAIFLFTLQEITKSFDIFQTTTSFTVVLDAGHGGDDPGKVSTSGVKEKDINLAIALKCKTVLEQNGIHVLMTRETDCSLEDASVSNKKASDLKNRRLLMTGPEVDCAVSIHQNSYPDPSQHGSQVFYHPSSEESKRLASFIQTQTLYLTSEENTRDIKANSDYYLLKDTSVPTVIAEVCFLSNPSEAEMITDQQVQEKAAFAIAMGIMQYLYS